MTIKQMAALRVAKILAAILAVSIAVNIALHVFGIAAVGVALAIALLAYMVKFIYDIELSKLQSENSLEKIRKS
jgi:Flp pilus assembly protein TadB